MNIQEFVKERDAALLSLDKAQIEAYAKKHEVALPESEDTFWVAIHKARCDVVNLPEDAKELSRNWLLERGFYPGCSKP